MAIMVWYLVSSLAIEGWKERQVHKYWFHTSVQDTRSETVRFELRLCCFRLYGFGWAKEGVSNGSSNLSKLTYLP